MKLRVGELLNVLDIRQLNPPLSALLARCPMQFRGLISLGAGTLLGVAVFASHKMLGRFWSPTRPFGDGEAVFQHLNQLSEVIKANPGMQSIELNIEDPASISKVANELIAKYPQLNVLINNAGVMQVDDVPTTVGDTLAVSTVTTNLLGPIRMTSALVDHLKTKDPATIINISSVLGFVPLAMAAVYSSTKAAIHSYSQSLRYRLGNTAISVQEIAPPWVQTDLLNSNNEPRAMPLKDFIAETMKALGTDANEVLVERAVAFRNNPGPNEAEVVTQFNNMMAQPQK